MVDDGFENEERGLANFKSMFATIWKGWGADGVLTVERQFERQLLQSFKLASCFQVSKDWLHVPANPRMIVIPADKRFQMMLSNARTRENPDNSFLSPLIESISI